MFRLRSILPLAALGLAAMLGGCVAYPAYPRMDMGTQRRAIIPAAIMAATTVAAGAADRSQACAVKPEDRPCTCLGAWDQAVDPEKLLRAVGVAADRTDGTDRWRPDSGGKS